jgi:hypothetical protein
VKLISSTSNFNISSGMACIKLHKKIALFKIFGFAPQDIEQLLFYA